MKRIRRTNAQLNKPLAPQSGQSEKDDKMKRRNRNHIDMARDTMLMARATIGKINGEKDIPFWVGLTDGEKYGKRFAPDRANFYRRKSVDRREFKTFYLRLCNEPELRARIIQSDAADRVTARAGTATRPYRRPDGREE